VRQRAQFLDSNRDQAVVIMPLVCPQGNMYSTEVADREGIPLQMCGQKWLEWKRLPQAILSDDWILVEVALLHIGLTQISLTKSRFGPPVCN
jgi:hypothetical protein